MLSETCLMLRRRGRAVAQQAVPRCSNAFVNGAMTRHAEVNRSSRSRKSVPLLPAQRVTLAQAGVRRSAAQQSFCRDTGLRRYDGGASWAIPAELEFFHRLSVGVEIPTLAALTGNPATHASAEYRAIGSV